MFPDQINYPEDKSTQERMSAFIGLIRDLNLAFHTFGKGSATTQIMTEADFVARDSSLMLDAEIHSLREMLGRSITDADENIVSLLVSLNKEVEDPVTPDHIRNFLDNNLPGLKGEIVSTTLPLTIGSKLSFRFRIRFS